MIEPLWRTVWKFLKILRREVPCDPEILLLGIHPEKTTIQKGICSTIYYSWDTEATLMSIKRGMDEVVVRIQWNITQQKKKKGNIFEPVLVVVEPRAFYTE